MEWIFLALFWLSSVALLHSYILFPLWMRWMARTRTANQVVWAENAPELPYVSVLLSAYNEEKVIGDKLQNLISNHYPSHKIHYFVGSDCSSDQTNAIIEAFCRNKDQFTPYFFEQRRGKPPVINDLFAAAVERRPEGANHILLLTDASVLWSPEVVFELVKHFKNPKIGVVDAYMQNTGLKKQGISTSENQYMSREVALKHYESVVFTQMMGPFGGCYALRSDLFEPVPPNYLVDDFYLTFRAMEKGFGAINELKAPCFEGATHAIQDEFRRKRRIAAGSFTNLAAFKKWVLPPVTSLGFLFFSHKVLRWFGGFFLLGSFIGAAFLAQKNLFYATVFYFLLAILWIIPILFQLFKKVGFEISIFKNIAYFVTMNIALMAGFFKYISGIQENIWTPTKRY